MGIGLYLNTNINSKISDTNKFSITFDGRIGGIQDKQIYIRNDDITKWYNNIQLYVFDSGNNNIVNNQNNGWSWKLKEADIDPTNEEWNSISAGQTIAISVDLGSSTKFDIVTYVPIWLRIQIPSKQYVQTIETVSFNLLAQENAY